MKQSDIYTEDLTCLRSILLADHPEFQNWIDWLARAIQDWNQRREVAHHLRAYGGMGSFNDLPSMLSLIHIYQTPETGVAGAKSGQSLPGLGRRRTYPCRRREKGSQSIPQDLSLIHIWMPAIGWPSSWGGL